MLPRELIQRILLRPGSTLVPTRSLSTSSRRLNVITELESRGMVADLTSRALRKHVEQPTTVYLGVDPSARSLHVGNLAALIGLLHFRLKGHTALALIGGATGSVGDPSGRSTERNALAPSELNSNIKAITAQLTSFLSHGVPFAQSRTRRRGDSPIGGSAGAEAEGGSFAGQLGREKGGVRIENNLDWLGGMGLLKFLSTVGKTARMSTMLSRESVKSRLDSSSGLSFTEFSYQLLQAFDFLTLHQRHGCSIQLGGSDQLGNIMSGIEMIRKSKGMEESAVEVKKEEVDLAAGEREEPAYGLTMPLLTTASGEKFGKSAGNAVWLDPKMTSPFEFYQFFLRTTDEEVHKYLKVFSFIRVIEIEAIMADHKAHPDQRIAQKLLASEATELIHGPIGLRQSLAASTLFFSSEPITSSTPSLSSLIDALDAKPDLSTPTEDALPSLLGRVKAEEVLGKGLEKICVASGLFSSKTQARRALDSSTLHLNGVKLPSGEKGAHTRLLRESDLLDGGNGRRVVVLRSGKSVGRAVLVE